MAALCPKSPWEGGQGREGAHPAGHRFQSSTFRCVAGATQAGSNQGPQAPVHLSRPIPATWPQTLLSRRSKGSAASAPWVDEKQESVLSLAHIVQMGKQSGGDTPLPHGPSVCTGAGIGIGLKTLAGFVNLGHHHCRYSFETLKMCWF